MAANLWGNIYYRDHFAGTLSQDAAHRCTFIYDPEYLSSAQPAISFTLPLQEAPHTYDGGLHPFFDNLCAEGWLKNAQKRALGIKNDDRFSLLLAFGKDLAGAVSIIDPKPIRKVNIDLDDPEAYAALTARASLSGIQPKIGAIKSGRSFRAVGANELSTYIAKLPSGTLPDIIDIEYATTMATKALLKEDKIAEMSIASIPEVADRALLIKRFDRTNDGSRLHFEEFNQLLGHASDAKYDGCYENMANFISENNQICLEAELDTLFRRIMACIITGNTDAHLKNFAMMHTTDGLRLSPAYDLVASSYYPEFKDLALGIDNAQGNPIGQLKAKHIARLGHLFGLPNRAIMLACDDLSKRLDKAHEAIERAQLEIPLIKHRLHKIMEKRWNGTFASIGNYLSKKP